MGSTPTGTAAVLGDGGWGTTLAIHLQHLGHQVLWWGAFPDDLRAMARRRENVKYLPGVRIPRAIRITEDLHEAVSGTAFIVLAIPAQHLRSVVRRLRGVAIRGKTFLNVAKGIERATLKRMSQVVYEELGRVALAVLSGPNIAVEIARGHPASSVVAAEDSRLAVRVQRTLTSDRLRLYTSSDVIGVELGGALKNPIAIAAGISDGLGFGTNAKAALVTRGIVEVRRLGVALGARPETFWGLSGLGDLMTTCLAGRNHWLGQQIGRGRAPRSVLVSTPMVIEGVDTAAAAVALARQHRLELPITEQVHRILSHRQTPRKALQILMRRAGKAEAS